MNKPRVLDLFCGAGGAAAGYADAGFEVVGVDIETQPNYPYTFIRGDALSYADRHGWEYEVIHASPPCQPFSAMSRRLANGSNKPDLVAITRKVLKTCDSLYAIENVPGAPLEYPVVLCGLMFGLRILRHRLFESNMDLRAPEHIAHPEAGYWGDKPRKIDIPSRHELDLLPYLPFRGHAMGAYREEMGCTWMTQKEARQAVPPAYAKYIGQQFMEYLS